MTLAGLAHVGSYAALAPRRPIHVDIPGWLFWTIWIGIAAMFVALIVAVARQQAKRRRDLEALTLQIGYTYTERPDEAATAELNSIHTNMQLQRTAEILNLLRGRSSGCELVVFDQSYRQGKSRVQQTLVVSKFGAPLPHFLLCRENLLFRALSKLGYRDIDFDSTLDFSERYFLHGKDEAAIRALFTPALLAFFAQLPERHGVYVESSGPWLVVYRPGKIVAASELREFIEQVGQVMAAFRSATGKSAFGA
jgi:hypothetical protein